MVRLAAVKARRHVSHLDDWDTAARLRVAVVNAAEPPEAAEDPLNCGPVVAHQIGGPRDVVAVAADRKRQNEREQLKPTNPLLLLW